MQLLLLLCLACEALLGKGVQWCTMYKDSPGGGGDIVDIAWDARCEVKLRGGVFTGLWHVVFVLWCCAVAVAAAVLMGRMLHGRCLHVHGFKAVPAGFPSDELQ